MDESPPTLSERPDFTIEELRLAARNHGMPLEVLRDDVTPTGLHYLLIHYDIPAVDPETWRLRIDGAVRRPRTLALESLDHRAERSETVTLECAGNGRAHLHPRPVSQPWLHEAVGTARWRGVPLARLLEEAEVLDDAVEVVFTGADRGVEGGLEQAYQRSLPLEQARREEVLVAVAMNEAPLLPQHGAPARLIVPGWYGMASVKWLTRIEVVDRPFDGYQQQQAYRLRRAPDETGQPLGTIVVRALLVPPGIPDFRTRRRHVARGRHAIVGRAWSGEAPITEVAFSADGGRSWRPTRLQPSPHRWAWVRWEIDWHARETGRHELCCRAQDASGAVQPLQPGWNLGGYAVNAVQRVEVLVT